MSKEFLRAQAMERRRALPAASRKRWDEMILSALKGSAPFARSGSVFAYVSVGEEVGTYPIIGAALDAGKRVYVPYLPKGSREMLAVPLDSLSDLVPGAFGIPTAKNAEATAQARAKDPPVGLCLTPGLLFDLQGYRIGYGGGYYDRFLAAHAEAVTIGLCYAAQVADTPLPHDPWDRPLHYLLNENGLLTLG